MVEFRPCVFQERILREDIILQWKQWKMERGIKLP